jgi:mannose-6-phosphate isomerase-like protein (cupin superfamily)
MTTSVPQAQVFSYALPDVTRPKGIIRLAGSEQIRAMVQVVAPNGGETNLHSHGAMDSVYFVLKGRVRFYSDETTVLAELGPQEGLLMPHDCKYWFENAAEEPLELLQMVGFVPNVDRSSRTNYTPETNATVGTEYFDAGAPGVMPKKDASFSYKDSAKSF